ncbi:phage tail protein [Flavobacterium sp.]|uniref:phage tail protein n=1 Tax=Flavobacterium sp. TaxID=239 RepID=UPI00374DD5BB
MKKLTFLAFMLMTLFTGTKSNAQIEPFVGQIAMVGFNFAPRGWAKCEGQLMSIASNSALFSLLGTTYGGDGVTTFALPDYRGRVPMGDGNGPGLTPRFLGEKAGTENHTLLPSEMPMHNHIVNANSAEGNQNSPSGNFPADTKLLDKEYSSTSNGATMNPQMVGMAGGNLPHNNIQPYSTITFIIALQGVYPSRP